MTKKNSEWSWGAFIYSIAFSAAFVIGWFKIEFAIMFVGLVYLGKIQNYL